MICGFFSILHKHTHACKLVHSVKQIWQRSSCTFHQRVTPLSASALSGVSAAHVWNGLPSDVIKSPSPSNNGSRHGSSAARLISDSLTPVHNLRDTVVGFIFASLKLLKFYWLYGTTTILTHNTHPFKGPLSGTTRVSRYQKGKTNLDFTEARDSEWQWHQLGHMQVSRQITTPAPHYSVFTGRMPFLLPNQ